MRRTFCCAFAFVFAAALLLAGCGSGSGSTRTAALTSSATTATGATRCFGGWGGWGGGWGQHHADNWIHQGGLFRWAGAGYDWDSANWLWQRPRRPHWPNVVITAHIGYDNDHDNDDDDDDPLANLPAGPPQQISLYGRHWTGWPSNPTAGNPDASDFHAAIELQDYRVQFHLADFAHAKADGKLVAHIRGRLYSDCGLYAGLHMPGKADKLEGGISAPTGKLIDGMVGPNCARRNNFDLQFALSDGVSQGGSYFAPVMYDTVPGGTVPESLYWAVNTDAYGTPQPGEFALDWTVTLLPDANQPAGVYTFDPEIVLRPVR